MDVGFRDLNFFGIQNLELAVRWSPMVVVVKRSYYIRESQAHQ